MDTKTTKQCLDLYRAVILRGFSIKEIERMNGHDGVAWRATLCKGKAKVVTASNDGNGGPDWVDIRMPGESRAVREAKAQPILDELFSIEEVAASIRALDISIARMTLEYGVAHAQAQHPELTADQVREKLTSEVAAQIEAINAAPPRRDEEAIGSVIGDLMDTAKLVASLKRTCKTATVWFRRDEPMGSFMRLKRPETPEVRQAVLAKHGTDFEAFASDALLGL